MISLTITVADQDTPAFMVKVEGELRRPKAINDALGRRLARELQAHFRARNSEPNKMAAPKTNFWKQVADFTSLTSVTDDGAVVTVGSNTNFRIHLLGGTIKPVRAAFLTIPLIPEARGLRASQYERQSGHKLFRPHGSRVLMERTNQGDRSNLNVRPASMRTKTGTRVFNLAPRVQVRPVYALATQAVIHEDPRALPPVEALAAALQDTANSWAERELKLQGGQP